MRFVADAYVPKTNHVFTDEERLARQKHLLKMLSHNIGERVAATLFASVRRVAGDQAMAAYDSQEHHALAVHILTEAEFAELNKVTVDSACAALRQQGYKVMLEESFDHAVLAQARELLTAAAK